MATQKITSGIHADITNTINNLAIDDSREEQRQLNEQGEMKLPPPTETWALGSAEPSSAASRAAGDDLR